MINLKRISSIFYNIYITFETRNHRFVVLPSSVKSVDGRLMVGRWSVDGRLMEGRWLVSGLSMVGPWSVDGWSMVSQWLVDGQSMVG